MKAFPLGKGDRFAVDEVYHELSSRGKRSPTSHLATALTKAFPLGKGDRFAVDEVYQANAIQV